MSDFGNETATAAFKASEKTIDALMKLLKYLLERNRNKVNNALKKEQLNEMKLDSEKRKAKLKLSNKVGEVNAKLLIKSGEKLRPLSIALNNEQLRNFDYYATKYGIMYSSISNQREEGVKSRIVIIREKDLELVKDITDRMNENIKLKDIDEQISELESKGNLTEEEQNALLELQKQKDSILREGTNDFNSENAEIIFSDICGELQNKSMSFDRALNRFTDRDFSKDKPYYICERTNPSSYIELKSTLSEFRGQQYTRTDYKVFNDNEEQKCNTDLRADGNFTDERFQGRKKDFWQLLKSHMKAKGGFSDDIVIFNTREELENYQSLYEKERSKNIIEEKDTHREEYRDFVNIDRQLRKQLDEKNAEININGQAIDKESKKVLSLKDESLKTTDEKIRVADVLLISKSILNYERMNQAQTRLAMDKQQYEMNLAAIENTPQDDVKRQLYEKMQNELTLKIQENEKALEKGKELESSINKEREQLSGIYAVYEVEREYDSQIIEELHKNEIYHDENTKSLVEWKGQVNEERLKVSMSKVSISIESASLDKKIESANLDKKIENVSFSIDDR